MKFEELEIGNHLGMPNFPHQIGQIVDIQKDVLVVEFSGMVNDQGQKAIGIITKRQFSYSGLVKLDIQEGEIVNEEKRLEGETEEQCPYSSVVEQ